MSSFFAAANSEAAASDGDLKTRCSSADRLRGTSRKIATTNDKGRILAATPLLSNRQHPANITRSKSQTLEHPWIDVYDAARRASSGDAHRRLHPHHPGVLLHHHRLGRPHQN